MGLGIPMKRLLLLALLTGCSGEQAPAPRSPDVLLVILDTVREDAAFGTRRPGVTPQLDALATQGARFSDVTTHGSWTWPSHTSLFTGRPPWEHGARFAPPDEAALLLGERKWSVGAFPTDLTTLAEQFQAAGYRTVSLSENPLIGPDLGSTRGFAVAEVQPAESTMAWVYERAGELLRQPDDRPLFLFVNILDAHHPWLLSPVGWLDPHRETLRPGSAPDWIAPFVGTDHGETVLDLLQPIAPGGHTGEVAFHTGAWTPPPEAATLFRDLYDASVHRADFKLHKVVKDWTNSGRSGVLAVTSDHGELLGEHGALFHGRTVWPELTQVPLVLVAPGRIPAGRVVDSPIQMTDLHDTLLDLSGIGTGPRSLVAAATGAGSAPTGPIEAAAWPDVGFGEKVGGRYTERWRMHRDGDFAVVVGDHSPVAYFDLAADPTMEHNLLDGDSSRAAAAEPLSRAARAWTERPITRGAQASPETIQALQALGYVDRSEDTPSAAAPQAPTP